MKKLSLRSRLTLLFAFIFGSTTLVFSIFSFYKLHDTLLSDFDNALYNYTIDVSQTIEIGAKNDLNFPPLIVEEGKIFPFPSGTALILVRHISGKILVKNGSFGDFEPPYKKDIEHILSGSEASYRTLSNISDIPDAEAGTYRQITFPLDSETQPTLFLQIAVPMVSLENQLTQLENILTFGLPFVIFVAIIAGLYVASRALRPVQNIISVTNKIEARDLHERIPIPPAKDEIQQLAITLNQMLERIEKSFESQERFVSDASHQLLTPITILRGEIETHAQEFVHSDQSPLYRSLLQETDKLSKIIKDMLLLARIDSGQNTLQLAEVYIDEIVIDVISRLQKLANIKNIQIKLDFFRQESRLPIQGDYDLLSNLITNLLENSIKYSPSDSVIETSLEWTGTSTQLKISDNGPGIPEHMKTHIFNRFSRADTSSQTSGFGLGLAIAQKIANLHKSEIRILSKQSQGALFYLELTNKI
ncbi:MAG: sensor histidine kinase [Pseudobdellovibrio sp.]